MIVPRQIPDPKAENVDKSVDNEPNEVKNNTIWNKKNGLTYNNVYFKYFKRTKGTN